MTRSELSAASEIMPGFRKEDSIIVITGSGRTHGTLHDASVSGITFTCEHGFRFVPWTAVRVVILDSASG